MVRRDYILRMIEQLGAVWAVIVRAAALRAGGKYQEAGALLDQTMRQQFGFGGDTLERLSADELIAVVRLGRSASVDEEVIVERLLLLGAILREQADLHAAQGSQDKAAGYALKALRVDLTVLVDEGRADERASAAIAPLLGQLADYELPAGLKEQLWRFYEGRSDFAAAENWLFKLLDDEPARLPAGIAFYERINTLPDEVLRRGGLPRDEIADALAELRARGD